MAKLFLNSRDELMTVDVDLIAVVQASGNYSRIVYINKQEQTVSIGISDMEQLLKRNNTRDRRFVRLGRSLIVNHAYLSRISLTQQLLVLADRRLQNELRVRLSKTQLKNYKDAVAESIRIKNGRKEQS